MRSRVACLPAAVLLAAAPVLYGCSLFEPGFDDYVDTGGTPRKKKPTKIEQEMVFAHPKTRPDWAGSGVTKAPGSSGDLHFTGVSKQFSTEQDARMDALRDAREQIAAYVVTDVKRQVQRVSVASGRSSEILDPGTVQEEIARLLSAATLVGTASTEYYVQQWLRREDGAESHFWKAYALVIFPEKPNREIRAAVLRSTAQRRVDQLEALADTRSPTLRDFDGRLQAVRQAMKEGRHVDAISQAQDLLDRLMPEPEEPKSKPTPKNEPVPPSAARSGKGRAQVHGGLHATHRALEALSQDKLVQARKLLLDARSEAGAAAKRFHSAELGYQERLFDEFLKASVDHSASASAKASPRQSLEGLLQSYWRAAAPDGRCPRCGAVHKIH